MGIRKLSADGERRYRLALQLSNGCKERVHNAVAIALSDRGGLQPYESEFERRIIEQSVRKKVLSRLSWEEDVRHRDFLKAVWGG